MTTFNEIRDNKAQCQIVVFPWHSSVPVESLSYADLALSDPIDVTLELEGSISFEKDLGQPAGSFSFNLANTRDWKRTIRPGSWCLIYMSQTGGLSAPEPGNGLDISKPDLQKLQYQSNFLRGICYIERVAVKGNVLENGTYDISYQVTGRDYGIVYEETTVWHNFFNFESGIIDAAANFLNAQPTQTIDNLLKTIHQLFYSPSDFPSLADRDPKDKERATLSQVGFQWLLPKEMLTAVGLKLRDQKLTSFFGHIDGLLNLAPTKTTIPIENPMATLNGNAWEKLKSNSVEQFHELFCELDVNGKPQLNFRPIPWKLDGLGYPDVASFVTAYRDLAATAVKVDNVEVLEFDVGEDDHSRYNHFYTNVSTSDYTPYDNITELQFPSPAGNQFPQADLNSIARHGFRPMHVEINALIQLGLNVDAKPDQKILVQYNELIADYWRNAVYFETGSVTISGRQDVRIGKGFLFPDDAPYNANKMFYIEGYSDEFIIEDNGIGEWVQSIKLVKGAELDAIKKVNILLEDSGLSKRLNEFQNAGELVRK